MEAHFQGERCQMIFVSSRVRVSHLVGNDKCFLCGSSIFLGCLRLRRIKEIENEGSTMEVGFLMMDNLGAKFEWSSKK